MRRRRAGGGAVSARELSSEASEAARAVARAEAESIAARWVPAHMTARQGMVDDIAAALINARRLERDACVAWIRDAEGDGVAAELAVERAR